MVFRFVLYKDAAGLILKKELSAPGGFGGGDDAANEYGKLFRACSADRESTSAALVKTVGRFALGRRAVCSKKRRQLLGEIVVTGSGSALEHGLPLIPD